MKPAIRVEHLSKQYRLGMRSQGGYRTLRESVAEATLGPWRRIRSFAGADGVRSKAGLTDTLQALNDVSFDVHSGEVVGVIGRNGAGKSTLLKILSRITEPTSGRAVIHGRVGSLLEVGTGFHPELTGRENIYMNGGMLGMSRNEIRRKFDAIVDFAEVECFLDTPVKRYSSGMYVRLAFAVAAFLEPEILIVDEVLAVGDALFQKKCLGKMSDLAKGGRTVVFVSHNMLAVEALCSRALLFERGRVTACGNPRTVVSKYMGQDDLDCRSREWQDIESAPGNSAVRLRRVAVHPTRAKHTGAIDVHTELTVEFDYWNRIEGIVLNPSVVVYAEDGRAAFNTVPTSGQQWTGGPCPRGLFRSGFVIPSDLLNDGIYEIELLLVRDASVVVHRFEALLRFQVVDDMTIRKAWFGKWPGVVRPKIEWKTELLSTADPEVCTAGDYAR